MTLHAEHSLRSYCPNTDHGVYAGQLSTAVRKQLRQLGVVAHIYNPHTWEMEAGGSVAGGQPGQQECTQAERKVPEDSCQAVNTLQIPEEFGEG